MSMHPPAYSRPFNVHTFPAVRCATDARKLQCIISYIRGFCERRTQIRQNVDDHDNAPFKNMKVNVYLSRGAPSTYPSFDPGHAIRLRRTNPGCRNNQTVFPAGFPLGRLGRFLVISKGF